MNEFCVSLLYASCCVLLYMVLLMYQSTQQINTTVSVFVYHVEVLLPVSKLICLLSSLRKMMHGDIVLFNFLVYICVVIFYMMIYSTTSL
jgi:hypothetical protein